MKKTYLLFLAVALSGCVKSSSVSPEHEIKRVARYSNGIHDILVFEYRGHYYLINHKGAILHVED